METLKIYLHVLVSSGIVDESNLKDSCQVEGFCYFRSKISTILSYVYHFAEDGGKCSYGDLYLGLNCWWFIKF